MDSSTVGVESLELVLLPHGPAAQFGCFRGASLTWLERSGAHNSRTLNLCQCGILERPQNIYIYFFFKTAPLQFLCCLPCFKKIGRSDCRYENSRVLSYDRIQMTRIPFKNRAFFQWGKGAQ